MLAQYQQIAEAWNNYRENDILDKQIVRPEVANSWKRCRDLKLDPINGANADLKGLELKERLEKLQHFVAIARPFMEKLYNFVRGSGFQVVLADEHGFLLEVMGDPEIVRKTSPIHLCPGGNWNETVKGTNAIGTAIVEKVPVQIHAVEHYCQVNHFLTCSAAPIFDPDGQLLGVLDISGDYKVANPHTLGMVVASVNAIENQLRLHKATTKLYVAYKYSQTIMESISEGLLTIDNNGIVTQLNPHGGTILGVNPKEAIGKHINILCKRTVPMLEILTNGLGYRDKEVVLHELGKRVFSTASALHDDDGNIIGAVATLRESKDKQVQNLLQRSAQYEFENIIGESQALKEAKLWAFRAAAGSSTIFLNGESGTGKELFAQAIHNAGVRKNGPFVPVNCAALPENLIESELFGYVAGAFTGSKKGGQAGKFELAHGGTIFLDEVGDMSLNAQVKLLRVIQEKKIARIGSEGGEIPVDIRIIAATNKNLREEVNEGRFREDLYYRLNVITIKIPALRERNEDIPLLARHFLSKFAPRLGRDNLIMSVEFLAKLQCYAWPGNIRELENAIERAVYLAGPEGILTPELLGFEQGMDLPGSEGTLDQSPKIVMLPAKQFMPLKEMEKQAIAEALAIFEGNISKVSAKLGIGRNTLYRKMKEYDIG